MFNQLFKEFNPYQPLPAKAAAAIAADSPKYKMFLTINNLIYDAAMRGCKSVRHEVIRNSKYDACKMYHNNESLVSLIKAYQDMGYTVILMIDEDSKAGDYFSEMLISW